MSRRKHLAYLRELGAKDRSSRCPVCLNPFGQTRFWKMGDDVSYCSRECMDTAEERAALEKAAQS